MSSPWTNPNDYNPNSGLSDVLAAAGAQGVSGDRYASAPPAQKKAPREMLPDIGKFVMMVSDPRLSTRELEQYKGVAVALGHSGALQEVYLAINKRGLAQAGASKLEISTLEQHTRMGPPATCPALLGMLCAKYGIKPQAPLDHEVYAALRNSVQLRGTCIDNSHTSTGELYQSLFGLDFMSAVLKAEDGVEEIPYEKCPHPIREMIHNAVLQSKGLVPPSPRRPDAPKYPL